MYNGTCKCCFVLFVLYQVDLLNTDVDEATDEYRRITILQAKLDALQAQVCYDCCDCLIELQTLYLNSCG